MKKLIAIFIAVILLIPNGVWAAIAFDTATTDGAWASRPASISWSHTVTGTNNVLLVGISMSETNGIIDSVTYNGVAMAQAVQSPSTRANIWYLANPSTGANTITANISYSSGVSNDVWGGAVSFSGVDQSDPLDAVASQDSTGSEITTTVDNAWTFDVFAGSSGGAVTMTARTNRTERWNNAVFNTKSAAASTMGPVSPAGLADLDWSQGSSGSKNTATVSLTPFVAGSPSTPSDLIIGTKNLIIGTKNLIIN